jgi:single stranded DNA-binding protein
MQYLQVIGRLGADSELKTSKNGKQFLTMRVASNDFIGGENLTTWISVLWGGERAVKMAEHLKKGSQVIINGTPKYSLYKAKSGESAIDVSVFADRVDFVSSNSGGTQSNEAVAETGTFKKKEPAVAAATAKNETNESDDLPF